jgi:putative transcriptional regulator
VGVSRQTINSIEKGRYHPNLRLAFKIARAFGKRVEEVFVYSEAERRDESALPQICSE